MKLNIQKMYYEMWNIEFEKLLKNKGLSRASLNSIIWYLHCLFFNAQCLNKSGYIQMLGSATTEEGKMQKYDVAGRCIAILQHIYLPIVN